MLNFKPKPIKKTSLKNNTIVTLDNKHDEMLNKFDNIDNDIVPNLLKERSYL